MKVLGLSILFVLLFTSCKTTAAYNPASIYYGESVEITLLVDKSTQKKLNDSAKLKLEVYWRKLMEDGLEKEILIKVYEKIFGVNDSEINKKGREIKINVQMINWGDIETEMNGYMNSQGYFEEPFIIKIYIIDEILLSESDDIIVGVHPLF